VVKPSPDGSRRPRYAKLSASAAGVGEATPGARDWEFLARWLSPSGTKDAERRLGDQISSPGPGAAVASGQD